MEIMQSNTQNEVVDPCAGTGAFLEGYGDLLTTEDIAEITHLCTSTIRSQIKAGKLPGRSIGRQYFVPKIEFKKYFSVR